MKNPRRIAVAAPTLSQELGLRIGPSHELPGLVTTDRAAREEIRHRAYALWEGEGHPESRQMEHWLAAEAEVLRPA